MFQRPFLSSALVLISVIFAACASDEPGDAGSAAAGSAGNDAPTAGAPTGTTAGPVVAAGGGGGGAGGSGQSGTGAAGVGGAGGGGGRSGRGMQPSAGTRSAAGSGGSGGMSGSAGSGGQPASAPPTAASAEDEGADCPVGMLPAANSLAAIAKLPDPFKKLDGMRLSSQSEWRCRRQEIKRMAETYAFGTKPPPPQSVTAEVSSTRITVNVMDNGKSASFSATVKLPSGGQAPYPAIVVYGGGGFGAPLDNNVINSEGVALITYNPFDVGKEGTPRNNKQGAFYTLYGSNSSTGLLVAWGWGVSRIIDAIAKSGSAMLKADAVGVTGCSRFGKGAFLAGVFDQRVALTMPIESGTAGVPIWRGIPGEGAQSLSSGYGEQPWFGDAFNAFTGSPTKAPIDTHELVAMVAPRGLFIMDNPHIANLGPKSAHVAALAGAEVYKALGAGGNISYWSDEQDGAHCSVRPEWAAPLKSNIQKFLKKTGNDPGVIKAASKATGDLAQWKDWETPALR